MQFTFLTSESTSLNSGITQLLTSDFTRAGLVLAVRSEPISTLYASAGACIGARSCRWQLANYLELWPLGWPGWVPGASTPFGCGSGGNYLNWCDPETQRLASLTHTSSSPSALAAFENYIAKEQPLIVLPMPVFRVSAIRGDLRGVTPQDPYLDIYPNQWYYAG